MRLFRSPSPQVRTRFSLLLCPGGALGPSRRAGPPLAPRISRPCVRVRRLEFVPVDFLAASLIAAGACSCSRACFSSSRCASCFLRSWSSLRQSACPGTPRGLRRVNSRAAAKVARRIDRVGPLLVLDLGRGALGFRRLERVLRVLPFRRLRWLFDTHELRNDTFRCRRPRSRYHTNRRH